MAEKKSMRDRLRSSRARMSGAWQGAKEGFQNSGKKEKPRLRGPRATSSPAPDVDDFTKSRAESIRDKVRGGNRGEFRANKTGALSRAGMRPPVGVGTFMSRFATPALLATSLSESVSNPDRAIERGDVFGGGSEDFRAVKWGTGALRNIGDTATSLPGMDRSLAEMAGEQIGRGAYGIREYFREKPAVTTPSDMLQSAAGGNAGAGGTMSGTFRNAVNASGETGADVLRNDAPYVAPNRGRLNLADMPRGTGVVRSLGNGVAPIRSDGRIYRGDDGRGDQNVGSPLSDAETGGRAPRDARPDRLPEGGVKFKGDDLFSSFAQIGLNASRVGNKGRNIRMDREDARFAVEDEQFAADNAVDRLNAQVKALDAQTGSRTATKEEYEATRLLSQDLSSEDSGIRGRAARMALQETVVNGINTPTGKMGLAFIVDEIDKGSKMGLWDKIRGILGRDTSIGNNPFELLSEAGINVQGGDVYMGDDYISDLGTLFGPDIAPVVQSFLLNDVEETKRTMRDTRG